MRLLSFALLLALPSLMVTTHARADGELPVTIDLTPAIDDSLVSSQMMDDGVSIQSREGTRFVAIPFRYVTDATYDLRRASFDIHPVPPAPSRFIGFRAMIWNDGRAQFSRRANDPIYERLQITQAELGAPAAVVGINQSRPPGQQRAPVTKNRLARSGWAAVVVEIPLTSDLLSVAAAGGPAQEIRVSLLELAGKNRQVARTPDAPETTRWTRALSADSPAIVHLALNVLAAMRQELGQADYARWAIAVDDAIIQALSRFDADARRDAWSNLIRYGPMPKESKELIASSDAESQSVLVDLVRAELNQPSPGPDAHTNTLAVLSSVLRTNDPRAAAAAVDLLAAGLNDDVFECLASASATVRAAAIERCTEINTPAVRRRMVHALAIQAGPEDAARLGDLIKRDRIVIADPEDPILLRLRNADSDKTRLNLLAMLQGISLVPVLRSPTIASIFDSISDDKSPLPLRRAATILASDQVRLRAFAARSGEFPMRFPPQYQDPVRTVLHRITLAGPDDLRIESVAAMLREGNSLDAFEDIRAAYSGRPADRLAFLASLAARPGIERTDAVFALLMRALSLADAASALPTLQILDRLAGQRGEREFVSVNLAAKAGLSWESLADFSLSSDPKLAELASKWIFRLGHLSAQDRRQFLNAPDRDARAIRLSSASARLSRIVAGRYDILFIIELSWPVAAAGPNDVAAWLPPQRITLPGGTLEMKTRNAGREIQLYVDGKLRGFGTAQVGASSIQAPESWLPHLEPADENSLLAGRSMPGASSPPLVIAPGEVESSTHPGTLKLEVSDLLRNAIANDPATAQLVQPVNEIIPANLSIALRYAGMGSYVGIASRRDVNTPPPTSTAPPVLVNYAVLLERNDAADSASAAAEAAPRAATTISPQSPASNPR